MPRRTVSPNLQTPSARLVNKYWQRYRNEPKFGPGASAVRAAFRSFPNNKSEAHIRLKACVLNDVYSTNILDTGAVARHIGRLKVDRRLEKHDPHLVNDIADVPRSGGSRRAYSFASKYCALHQPKGYAIYDSFVDRLLWAYQCKDNFSDFYRNGMKDYPTFMSIVEDFRHYYSLRTIGLRKLDKFLWMYGKAKF